MPVLIPVFFITISVTIAIAIAIVLITTAIVFIAILINGSALVALPEDGAQTLRRVSLTLKSESLLAPISGSAPASGHLNRQGRQGGRI